MVESERSIGKLIDVVQRETLRTRLLFALDELYPKWLRTDLLYEIDKDMPLKVFEKELAYLEEKALVQRKAPRAGNTWANKISAKGRDFLDGHIHEVGLMSPEMCKGK